MIITRRHLPRRTFLRGAGATLALPLLDAMVPALTATRLTAAAPVRRFGVFYVPNGMAMPFWMPKTVGPMSELPPTLQPLAAFKDRVSILGGLDLEVANLIEPSGDHANSSGTFLSCTAFKATTGADVFNATTVDQLLARVAARETQLASLELSTEAVALLGTCDGSSSCAYVNTISWSSPTTPLPMENDPRAVFERLFGTSGSTDAATRLARIRRDRSILDAVGAEIERLGGRLGAQDRLRFTQYLDSVRDIERRIQKAEQQNTRELPLVNQPAGIPNTYEEHARLLLDLLALSYQTDMTRISTFCLAKELSGRAYPEIGVPDAHHPVSHHQNEPAKIERLHQINRHHVNQFAYFVKKLSETPEGDGTIFDQSLFLYGTGISDSNTHFHDDLPIALVGGQAAGIRGGRYQKSPKGTPLANLHVALLDRFGVPVEKFGDSRGKLDLSFDI